MNMDMDEKIYSLMVQAEDIQAHAVKLQREADASVMELRQLTDELKAVLAEFKAMTSRTAAGSEDDSTPDSLPAEDADLPLIYEPANSEESIFNKSIDELNLSTRSKNCLISSKINLIGQLVQYREREIASIEDLGKKSLKEIKDALEELKLSFYMKLEGFPEVDISDLCLRYGFLTG